MTEPTNHDNTANDGTDAAADASADHEEGARGGGLFDDLFVGLDFGDADVDLDEDLEDDADGDLASLADALRASSQAGEEVQEGDLEDHGDDEGDDDEGQSDVVGRIATTTEVRALSSTVGLARTEPSAELKDMLDGAVPMFVVHRSHRHARHLPELLSVARRRVRGKAGLGVAVRLPRMTPASARTFLDGCSAATMKIADPELFTLDGSDSPSEPYSKAHERYSWAGTIPTAPDPAWARQVLASQRDAGANVFLSASGWVPETNGRTQLAAAMAWVRTSRAEAGNDPMFVNLTMSHKWLTDTTLRNALKQELVESNESLWWLRFYWPIVDPRYGQLVQAAILDGYKDLATTAALEDKVLVLPNSGLTGWMATVWGAQGFSTGTSWAEQMYGAQRRGGSVKGQPKPPPVELFFDRTVLHSVPYTDHLTMTGEPKHLRCRCRFCQRLGAMTNFDRPTADLHYLLTCAELTASLRGRRPGLEALRQVKAARTFNQALSPALTGRARPLHLPVWEARLP